MSPSLEHSNGDTAAPAVPPSSHFTAVNGSSGTSLASTASRSQPPSESQGAQQQQPPLPSQQQQQSAPAPRRASTPPASRSGSGSGDEGEGDGGSDLESSLAHSPVSPTSKSYTVGDTNTAGTSAPRSGPNPFSASSSSVPVQPLPNESSPNNANTVHKRKRSSQSPNPHPPHARTNDYTPSGANVDNQPGPRASSLGFTNDDHDRKPERQQSSEIRDGPAGYGRETTGLSSERGESQEASYTNGEMMMLDSQASQLSGMGPSQQLSHEQSQGYPTTPGVSRDPDHKRKRIFSNRTKTGCITCRRRKKKCDEAKPECENCKRGGFICEGYSGRVSWQKPQTKSPGPVTLSQKYEPGSASVSPTQVRLTLLPQVQPQAIQQAPPQIPPQTSFQVNQAPQPVRIIERPPQQPSQEYGVSQPAPSTHHHGHAMPQHVQVPPVPQSVAVLDHRYQKQPLPEHRSHGSIGMPISGAPGAPVRGPPAPFREIRHAKSSSQDMRSSHTPQQPPPFAEAHRPPPNRGPNVFSVSEKEKMLNGEYFHAFTPELLMERDRCKAACWKFNNASNPTLSISRDEKLRFLMDILRPSNGTRGPQSWSAENEYQVGPNGQFSRKQLPEHNGGIGGYPAGEEPWIEAPFTCDYGYNIKLGQGVFINFGCTIIDTCTVTIKARTLIGPNCQIYSGGHPLNPKTRRGIKGPEFGKPIVIEEDCWIGGNVTILPGVKIGTGATVGAGSVVTKDVPPNTVAAGNPCKVLKGILEHE